MAMQGDPELISSYRHTEYTPTYREISPEEEPRADRIASAQQMIEGPHREGSAR